MRVNFWCGRQVLDGFFNVDAVRHPKAKRDPELIHAMTFDAEGRVVNPLPLEDGCATELHAMHAVEHVRQWEAPYLVGEFKRLLRPGGLLVLELPNIEAAARNLLAGMDDQMTMFAFYGDGSHRDPYMCHPYGYTPKSIEAMLRNAGFTSIFHKPPQTHGARKNRDMRVEALA